jgi:benzoyl-CoA-dihydrodiol lyase
VEERRDAEFWPLAMTRELDDLILRLRTNEPTLGTWLIRTEGDPEVVLAYERQLAADDWFANEITHYYKRTLKRLDVTSRSLIALIEPGSCFAGMLAELAFAADRQYILDDQDAGTAGTLILTDVNFGRFPMGNGLSRLESRFWGDRSHVDTLRKETGTVLSPDAAKELGLVTDALDDIDWADEIRIVVEGRAALSPVRRPRDDRDEGLRPPLRLAELGFRTPQRLRRTGGAAPLRHRPEGGLRQEASVSA